MGNSDSDHFLRPQAYRVSQTSDIRFCHGGEYGAHTKTKRFRTNSRITQPPSAIHVIAIRQTHLVTLRAQFVRFQAQFVRFQAWRR